MPATADDDWPQSIGSQAAIRTSPTSGLPQPIAAAERTCSRLSVGPPWKGGQRLGSFVDSHSQKKFINFVVDFRCHLLRNMFATI